jgi:acetolactate synthase I/II/III large subunit
MVNISQAIWERVKQEVDTVFYLPGGGCGPLVDALGQSGLRAVACLHEQSAGYAAVAYAQHRGFGVALVTSGPGATNIMTPCLAAWVDSVPLLIISGQVMVKWLATDGMRCRGTQEGPTVAMAKPITKFAEMPKESRFVLWQLDDAIETAKSGRPGPVWLDVPMDVQNAEL